MFHKKYFFMLYHKLNDLLGHQLLQLQYYTPLVTILLSVFVRHRQNFLSKWHLSCHIYEIFDITRPLIFILITIEIDLVDNHIHQNQCFLEKTVIISFLQKSLNQAKLELYFLELSQLITKNCLFLFLLPRSWARSRNRLDRHLDLLSLRRLRTTLSNISNFKLPKNGISIGFKIIEVLISEGKVQVALEILENHLVDVAELRTPARDGPVEESVHKIEKWKDETWREFLVSTLHQSRKELPLHPARYLLVENSLVVPSLVLLSDGVEIRSNSHRVKREVKQFRKRWAKRAHGSWIDVSICKRKGDCSEVGNHEWSMRGEVSHRGSIVCLLLKLTAY